MQDWNSLEFLNNVKWVSGAFFGGFVVVVLVCWLVCPFFRMILCFFHHTQNNNLHSNCKYFIIHDKNWKLWKLQLNVKAYKVNWVVMGCLYRIHLFCLCKPWVNFIGKKQREPPQDHFMKYFPLLFTLTVWIRQRNNLAV